MCNEYNVDAIPVKVTPETETVLNVLKIKQHPKYSPGTASSENLGGPFAGYDISVYHVNDTNLVLEEGELWPACLPKLEESIAESKSSGRDKKKDFFAGWMDPEPPYRTSAKQNQATRTLNYFVPRQIQVKQVTCSDPKWMNSTTYYPPATICYKDPSESSCFQNGNSGSSVMTHFNDNDGTEDVDAYAFAGPLSMHKGCDQVRPSC